jgi:ribose 5-phosphate isomerase B
MRILIASDHAGYELKQLLAAWLKEEEDHEVEDLGPHTLEPEDDYPDYIMPLAQKVAQNKDIFGIVLGFSGQGEAMAANRVKGARAAVYYGGSEELLRLTREHNNANILSLGAQFLTPMEAKEAIIVWLSTDFTGAPRHVRRIEKLDS